MGAQIQGGNFKRIGSKRDTAKRRLGSSEYFCAGVFIQSRWDIFGCCIYGVGKDSGGSFLRQDLQNYWKNKTGTLFTFWKNIY